MLKRVGLVVAALYLAAGAAWAQTPASASKAALGFGVEILQDGKPVAVEVSDLNARRTVSVTLKRAPFELRVPAAAWSGENADAGVQIAVSNAPGFADVLKVNALSEETAYFGRATMMALPLKFEGVLLSAGTKPETEGYGHNYVEFEMLDTSQPGYHSIPVNKLEDRYSDDSLMDGASPVTLVVYLDRRLGPPAKRDARGFIIDWIDGGEVEVLQITFVD